MISPTEKPEKKRGDRKATARDAIRDLLHDYYIEIATSKMSKDKFEEYIDRFINAVTSDKEE